MTKIELCSIKDLFIYCSFLRDHGAGDLKPQVDRCGDFYTNDSIHFRRTNWKELFPGQFFNVWEFPMLKTHKKLNKYLFPTINELWYVLGYYVSMGHGEDKCCLYERQGLGWFFQLDPIPGPGVAFWNCYDIMPKFLERYWNEFAYRCSYIQLKQEEK